MLIPTHLAEIPSIKSFHSLSVDAKAPCSAHIEKIMKDLFTIKLRVSYHRRYRTWVQDKLHDISCRE